LTCDIEKDIFIGPEAAKPNVHPTEGLGNVRYRERHILVES
jgi:hypothetical protein